MTETTRRDDSTARRTDAPDVPTADPDKPTLKDVDHTPPGGAPDANRVFERGGERRPAATDGGGAHGCPDEDDDPAEA